MCSWPVIRAVAIRSASATVVMIAMMIAMNMVVAPASSAHTKKLCQKALGTRHREYDHDEEYAKQLPPVIDQTCFNFFHFRLPSELSRPSLIANLS